MKRLEVVERNRLASPFPCSPANHKCSRTKIQIKKKILSLSNLEKSSWCLFIACVRNFYQIFISHQVIALNNYEKCFLFHWKSFFVLEIIQNFVFSSSLLFLPVSHCFRGWWKINLKVSDAINCLNKNLITYKLCPLIEY